MNYNANQSAVMTPDHSVFFTITTESINEMLQLQPSQSITPLSVGDLFNRFPKLTLIKVARLYQTFIREEKYIPKDTPPPPHMWTIFFDLGQDIIEMISSVLGQTISEFVDEIIVAFMSIYSLGQPLAVMFEYAKFITDKMHEVG